MSNRGNPLKGMGEESPDVSLERIKSELKPDYRVTDKQFDISRKIGGKLIGIDLINAHDRSRVYLTYGSSLAAEDMLRKKLGDVLLKPTQKPEQVSHEEDIQAYEVPDGARWLLRTLRQAPYRLRYMERLTKRAAELLSDVQLVDPNLFGASLGSIVVGHTSESAHDDTVLMIAPPLDKPNSPPISPIHGIPRELMTMDVHLRDVFESEFYGTGAGYED